MKVKVYGKAHLFGTSKKTGNKYDFIQIHCLVPARGVEGEAAKVVSVYPDMVNYDSIIVSKSCSVEVDFDGHVLSCVPEKF